MAKNLRYHCLIVFKPQQTLTNAPPAPSTNAASAPSASTYLPDTDAIAHPDTAETEDSHANRFKSELPAHLTSTVPIMLSAEITVASADLDFNPKERFALILTSVEIMDRFVEMELFVLIILEVIRVSVKRLWLVILPRRLVKVRMLYNISITLN